MTLNKDLSQICVFDTETTGVDYESARIVTAFAGLMGRDGVLTQTWSWLINPGVEIPAEAMAVHGITNEKAQADGQSPASAISEIRDVLAAQLRAGIPVVAYNARFDLTLLDRECRRNDIEPIDPAGLLPVVDPLVIDRALDKYRRGSRKLLDTAAFYGVTLEGAHEAEADATATGRLAWAVLTRISGEFTLRQIHDTQIIRAAEQADSFQAWLRQRDPKAYVEGQWPVKVLAEQAA